MPHLVHHAKLQFLHQLVVQIETQQSEAGVFHAPIAQRRGDNPEIAVGVGAEKLAVNAQGGGRITQGSAPGGAVARQVKGGDRGLAHRGAGGDEVGAEHQGELPSWPANQVPGTGAVLVRSRLHSRPATGDYNPRWHDDVHGIECHLAEDGVRVCRGDVRAPANLVVDGQQRVAIGQAEDVLARAEDDVPVHRLYLDGKIQLDLDALAGTQRSGQGNAQSGVLSGGDGGHELVINLHCGDGHPPAVVGQIGVQAEDDFLQRRAGHVGVAHRLSPAD